jgi:hypothetical protein
MVWAVGTGMAIAMQLLLVHLHLLLQLLDHQLLLLLPH